MHFLHFEKPYLREVRGCYIGGGVFGAAKWPLHVRLAGGDPYVTDEHVVQHDRVLPANGEFIGPASADGREIYVPMSEPIGNRRALLCAERDGDLLAGSGHSPD